jgi:OOP family OmpA-OmpF porin
MDVKQKNGRPGIGVSPRVLSGVLVGVLAGVLSVQMVHGEVHQGVEVGLGGFSSEYDAEETLSSGSGGLGQLGYRFDSPISVELQYMAADHGTRVGAATPEYETAHSLLNVLYHFHSGAKTEPYLALGAGQFQVDTGTVEMDDTSVNLAAGMKYHFGDYFLVRPELSYSRVAGDIDDNFFAVKLILSAAFGDRTPPPPPRPKDTDGDGVLDPDDNCPSTPEGEAVDAKGCPLPEDTDGDGVVDSQDACPGTAAGIEVDARGCKKPPQDSDGDGVYDHKDECPDTAAKLKVDSVGCPKRLTEKVSIRLDIKFDSNSAQIKVEHYPEIQKIATFLTEYEGTVVRIEGHTDTLGKASYNKALSQMRADAVAKVLVEDMNIAADRVTTMGFGEEKPIADDSTQAGRELNRRVVGEISAEAERLERKE